MSTWHKAPTSVSGSWIAYRYVAPDLNPLWNGVVKSSKQPMQRWHVSGLAQYLSLSITGAWAEACRAYNLRTSEQRLINRFDLWAFRVEVSNIANLSTFDALRKCGAKPECSIGRYEIAHDLAQQLQKEYAGVLTPSASYGNGYGHITNLALYGAYDWTEHHINLPEKATMPGQLHLDAMQVTASGSATNEAWRGTTFEDDRHTAFDLWCQERKYKPSVT